MEIRHVPVTQVVMIASAPLLMIVVSLFERRWGPMVAGKVAAAPITAMIGLLLVAADLGNDVSHEMAITMSGYVPAQIGIALVVAALVKRTSFLRGLAVGIAAYGCLAWVATLLPAVVAIATSMLLLIVSRRLVAAPPETNDGSQPPLAAGRWMIALRAGASLATALGLLVVSQRFGPAAGGVIGAFPIFTFTLCAFVFATSGQTGVRQVLAGMVHGLPAYFAFVLTYALMTPHIGSIGAALAGSLACACCYLRSAPPSAKLTLDTYTHWMGSDADVPR
ncbi:MAG TPA: hypothetical protein VG502_12060 [Flexivirga sp.]|uniref:hypothetical protein n=1 Tax=Flexivirga sp. TaxID=1962927 RepID=UPI002C688AB6|nr:hypothetical protein [Flexivirga sp.]HWC23025.1 hypothetical protein [Flexivirga sp.]